MRISVKGFMFVIGIASLVLPWRSVHAADDAYKKGLAEIGQKQWGQAAQDLSIDFPAGCNPPALYLLGLVYANLGNLEKSFNAENAALRCDPPLAAPYRDGALQLLEWATTTLGNQPIYHGSFTMSVDSHREQQKAADRAIRLYKSMLQQVQAQTGHGLFNIPDSCKATVAHPSPPQLPADDARTCLMKELGQSQTDPPPSVSLPQ